MNLGQMSDVCQECRVVAHPNVKSVEALSFRRPAESAQWVALPAMSVPPATRYAKGEARQREILAATVDLIYDEGISAVTHRAVAQRAQLRASAPSYFFPSIDDLILEAFRSIMATMIADLKALSAEIVEKDMDRETAVDAYIALVSRTAPKYDKLQFEAYMFSHRSPALQQAVEAVVAATHRPDSTLVTASRRDDISWAAPIFTALADGFGLQRLAVPGAVDFGALRAGLLALMEALPAQPKSRPKAKPKAKPKAAPRRVDAPSS